MKNKLDLDRKLARYRPIGTALLIGILIRIALGIYLTHNWDVAVWYFSFLDIMAGLKSPYTAMNFSYPPVWAFTFTPFVSGFSLFVNPHNAILHDISNGQPVFATHPIFNLSFRLPLILAEVFIGLLIFSQVLELRNSKMARKAFMLWFLNPLVIFISFVQGQFDALAALMLLLAFVFFIKEKYLLAGLSLGLGLLTKISPVFLLPAFVVFAFKDVSNFTNQAMKTRFANFLRSVALILAGLFLSLIIILPPVLISGSFARFVSAVFTRTEYITSFGGLSIFNISLVFPGFLYWLNEYGRPQIFFLALSILLVVAVFGVSFYYRFRSKLASSYQKFLYAQVLIIACIYLTSWVVNPQYIIWILPFLVLSYGIYSDYLKRTLLLCACAIMFGLYWMNPFTSLIRFSSLSAFGSYFSQMYSYYLVGFGYPIMVLSGLLGFAAIASLFLINPNFRRYCGRLNWIRPGCGEHGPE